MTATVLRSDELPFNDSPEAELCYAGGMGLLGLFIGFALTVMAFLMLWSLHYVSPLNISS